MFFGSMNNIKQDPTSVLSGKDGDRHFLILEHAKERVELGYREVKIRKVRKRGSRGEKK